MRPRAFGEASDATRSLVRVAQWLGRRDGRGQVEQHWGLLGLAGPGASARLECRRELEVGPVWTLRFALPGLVGSAYGSGIPREPRSCPCRHLHNATALELWRSLKVARLQDECWRCCSDACWDALNRFGPTRCIAGGRSIHPGDEGRSSEWAAVGSGGTKQAAGGFELGKLEEEQVGGPSCKMHCLDGPPW